MSEFVKSVTVKGLHGQFDFSCDFEEGVNIIYGKNGTGKTTLLHIIANVLNRDFMRFLALDFKQITVEFSKGDSITIDLEKISTMAKHFHYNLRVNGEKINKREFCPLNPDVLFGKENGQMDGEDDEDMDFALTHKPDIALSSAYFPAFRTAIDAWAITQEDNPKVARRYRLRKNESPKTEFARSLFGQFVPRLDYPATSEIEFDLNEKIGTAIANVSKSDRINFVNVPSKILEALSSSEDNINPDSIFQDIEKLSKKLQDYPIQVESISSNLGASIRSLPEDDDSRRVAQLVLSAYKEALNKIVEVQEASFYEIERYLKSVNIFLENKSLEISQMLLPPSRQSLFRGSNSPSVVVRFEGENSRPTSMSQSLSSGERQIVTLIYATTKMSKQDVILVDEPEISLNVDWQRKLLPEMVNQMPSKQLIVCTHSPIIGAKYREKMIELKSTQTVSSDDEQLDFKMFDIE